MMEQKELLFDDLSRKQSLLNKLKSNNLNKPYKRYNGSPLRYAGGKSLAVGYIISLLPDDLKRVVSPFVGGASVEIAIAKELGIPIVAYDIFDLLANYWNVQAKHSDKMYEKLLQLRPDKKEYERIKNILKQHWNKKDGYDGALTELDAAVYYYYNMQLSYGPGFLGWMSSIYENGKKYKSTIEKVKNFKLDNFDVYCESFDVSIPKHNKDFLYLDPPYFLDGDSKMFRGIYPMRNFPIHHDKFDHGQLAGLLKKHKGGFILSYNDCKWVRETYCDFKIVDVKWQYTMGQGETRIGKNRKEREFDNNHVKTSHEVLIIGEKK